ncbi:hypothetical protein F5Y16DRAFT_96067 [Xylariaceae sp. FL0255]|nr:hypothetical protein F5Y16DRAFT_96067 [Xylariaceae sp. FL0255]
MSGRSAYVRKKITEPNTSDNATQPARRRAQSSGNGLSGDNGSLKDHMLPQGTGYGTTNARFLKFSGLSQENESNDRDNAGSDKSGSDEGGRRGSFPQHQGPMPDYAYARARRPVLRTEDVSGIERSDFRSTVDKTSDGIRKGITKAFTLGLKKKKTADLPDERAPPAATIRPQYDYDDFAMSEVSTPSQKTPPVRDGDGQKCTLPPPSAKLPPLPTTSTAPPMKRWLGSQRPVQKWNKLRKDPELWDPNGDVLIYFGRKDQPRRPNPSFRLSSHIIEATESRFLINMLGEGSTEDVYGNPISLATSFVGLPPLKRNGGYSQATPLVSDDTALAEADGQISYEMYFPTPVTLNKHDAHLHAITTRNVFALLYHASLVGLSLFQALSNLLDRLDSYMEPNSDNVGLILNYLCARGIDDARNDAETAVSMLAWSELPEVRWEEGWREAFLHCAGMYSQLEACTDFKQLTPVTRALLERACLEKQLRVQAAEERLAAFTFEDMWLAESSNTTNSSKGAAERLQQFLVSQYAQTYGSWPPAENGASSTDGEDMWLTRTVAQTLQKDFGVLYDYLVNRDIIWDESETRSSRKWIMVSESGDKSFNADTTDLLLTDMLIEYDNRMRFPHIPHPYPLIPDSIPPSGQSTPTTEGRDKAKKDAKSKPQANDRNLEQRVHLAYTEATNVYALGTAFAQSDLVEKFTRFEKSDHIGLVDPFCARRGRWVVIYAVLQTLASVSVDAPGVRYKEGVAYHLSPRLKGARIPPWKGVQSPMAEATHELSHCWLASRSWGSSTSASSVLADSAAEESDADVRDPVARMARRQLLQQQQQQETAGTISRSGHVLSHPSTSSWSSNADGLMPDGRQSAWSSTSGASTPTMTAGWSVKSGASQSTYSDDTNSNSARIPAFSLHQNYHQQQQQHHIHPCSPAPRGDIPRSPSARGRKNNAVTVEGRKMETRRERAQDTQKWPTPSRVQPSHPSSNNSDKRMKAVPPTTSGLDVPGNGDFFNVPSSLGGPDVHEPEDDSNDGATSKDRLESCGGLGPLIRDFDELDLVIEEQAYGQDESI